MLEKTLESPLDCKEIQPVHSKGDQSWVFIGRTDVEAETPILWLPHMKSWLIGKDPDARRDWGQEEKGTTEDEMAGWHHQLNAHEFGWTPGDGDGQGGLACCDSWGCTESDMTERLTWLKAWTLVNIYSHSMQNSPPLKPLHECTLPNFSPSHYHSRCARPVLLFGESPLWKRSSMVCLLAVSNKSFLFLIFGFIVTFG